MALESFPVHRVEQCAWSHLQQCNLEDAQAKCGRTITDVTFPRGHARVSSSDNNSLAFSRYRAVIGVAHEPMGNVAPSFFLRNKRCCPVERGNRTFWSSQALCMCVVDISCFAEPNAAMTMRKACRKLSVQVTSKTGPRTLHDFELWWQAYSPRKASSGDEIGSNAQTRLSSHG